MSLPGSSPSGVARSCPSFLRSAGVYRRTCLGTPGHLSAVIEDLTTMIWAARAHSGNARFAKAPPPRSTWSRALLIQLGKLHYQSAVPLQSTGHSSTAGDIPVGLQTRSDVPG